MRTSFFLSLWLFYAFVLTCRAAGNLHGADIEDNEFADFEEFDEPEVDDSSLRDTEEKSKVTGQSQDQAAVSEEEDDDEATVEEEDDEFEHFQDEEEFEGYDGARPVKGKSADKPDLKITNVPVHLRANLEGYYVEMLMIAGLGVYFINFLAGRSKNQRLAQTFLQHHKDILEKNFSVVGDDGTGTEVTQGVLIKDAEHSYSLWCSGRVCCEGMLVELKLLKRQDLINTLSRFLKPATDQVVITFTLEENEMDNFVFCVAQKKTASRLQKEMNDLNFFCAEKKAGENYKLPSSFSVLSEIGEATQAMLAGNVVSLLERYEANVDFIHISDQYSGPKPTDDQEQVASPETKRQVMFCFNVGKRGNCSVTDMEALKPLIHFAFHYVDKVCKFKLSNQAKSKAVKNRQKLEESYQKMTHASRMEAAQARKEEKRRADRERMMAEEDPDKQRKLDDLLQRKDAKKKQSKMKVMKVKSQ